MANIKSQKKRNITNEKNRVRNKAVKSELKTAVKKVHVAAQAQDKDQALKAAQEAARLLDKAAGKGIIHKKQAANRKSGVLAAVNKIEG